MGIAVETVCYIFLSLFLANMAYRWANEISQRRNVSESLLQSRILENDGTLSGLFLVKRLPGSDRQKRVYQLAKEKAKTVPTKLSIPVSFISFTGQHLCPKHSLHILRDSINMISSLMPRFSERIKSIPGSHLSGALEVWV